MEAGKITAVLLLTFGLCTGRPIDQLGVRSPIKNSPYRPTRHLVHESHQIYPLNIQKFTSYHTVPVPQRIYIDGPSFDSWEYDSPEQFDDDFSDERFRDFGHRRVVRAVEPEGIEVLADDLIADAEGKHVGTELHAANAEYHTNEAKGLATDAENLATGTEGQAGEARKHAADDQPADAQGRFFLGKLFGNLGITANFDGGYSNPYGGYHSGLYGGQYDGDYGVIHGRPYGGQYGGHYGGQYGGGQVVTSKKEYVSQSHSHTGYDNYNNYNHGYYGSSPTLYRENYPIYGNGGYGW
ncbi:uncharacterized protein LOC108673944 [Hyalella azteca]|nr:uncharacterized protein LOC108673944 [Hyalella azteca]